VVTEAAETAGTTETTETAGTPEVLQARLEQIRRIAGTVPDPELPGVTIADLGILRGVDLDELGHIVVTLTPTYSGCPAVEMIENDVKAAVADAGWPDVSVVRVLAPAWTTDWITAEGRRKLSAIGIAPPQPAGPAAQRGVVVEFRVRCPWCGSAERELVSRFSSTACKALYRCTSCAEPFEHFKPL
jgi:ring-1,2-phenylacetyl-CoA epoxidase subunit PaaD